MSEKSRRMRILEEELEGSSLSDEELMKIKRRLRDVKAADRKDAGDTEILEDLSVDTMLVSKNDTAVGPIPVNTGEYVTIDRIDAEENSAYITIFDVNGELRDESVYVNLDDLKAFAAENEALTTEDIDEPVAGLEDVTEPEEVTEGAKRKSRRSRRSRRGRDDDFVEDDSDLELTEGRKRRSRRGRDDDDFEDEPEVVEGRRRSRRGRDGDDFIEDEPEVVESRRSRRSRKSRRGRDEFYEDYPEEGEVIEGRRRSRKSRRGRDDDFVEDDSDLELTEGRKRRSRRGRDDDDFEDEPEVVEGRRRSRRSRRSRGDDCEDCGDEHVTESFKRRMREFASKRKSAQRKVATARTGFDLQADSMTFICEAGDVMSFDGLRGTVSVTRRGQEVLRDLKVAKGTYRRCLEAGVFSSTKSVNECSTAGSRPVQVKGAMLSYKPTKGYTFVREGVETGLGSRLRARAWLAGNGYTVTPDQLDSAYAGKSVSL